MVLLFYFKRTFFLHFSSSPLRARSPWHCSSVFSFTFRPPFAPHSTPFLLPIVRDFESFHLTGSIFDFKSVWVAFRLKLCAHSCSSIFFCFYWYCYCIEHLFVLCCFGRVRLADLGLFVLLVLAWALRVRFWHHHCTTRGVFLCSLKWKNNMC